VCKLNAQQNMAMNVISKGKEPSNEVGSRESPHYITVIEYTYSRGMFHCCIKGMFDLHLKILQHTF